MTMNALLREMLLTDFADTFSNGRIDLYNGAIPDVDELNLGGSTLLGDIQLPSQPFTAGLNYIENLNSWSGWRNNIAGDLQWFRMYSDDDRQWIQGDITAVGGGGMLETPQITLPVGAYIVVTSARFYFT